MPVFIMMNGDTRVPRDAKQDELRFYNDEDEVSPCHVRAVKDRDSVYNSHGPSHAVMW